MRARGLDVSAYQPPAKMQYAAWRLHPGLCFGYARLTIGVRLDVAHAAHHAAMRAAGYLCGSYAVITEHADPARQARFFVDHLPPGDTLPPWLDFERAALTEAMLRAWCDEYDRISPRGLVMYTGKPIWQQIVAPTKRARYAGYGLAIAAYPFDGPSTIPQPMDPVSIARRSTPPAMVRPGLPDPWEAYAWWQHTGAGRLPGYDDAIDLDVYHGTEAELRAKYGGAVTTPPVTPADSKAQRILQRVAAIRREIGEL